MSRRFIGWWLIAVGLAVILGTMIDRLASGDSPVRTPEPVESLIPALCIEREPDGTVHPCKDEFEGVPSSVGRRDKGARQGQRAPAPPLQSKGDNE